LFSHPGDFTPVCTTELGEVARRHEDFKKRNVKVIGLSANSLDDHKKWIADINDYGGKVGPTDVQYPIVSEISYPVFLSPIESYGIDRSLMRKEKFPYFTICWTSRMLPIVTPRVYRSPYVLFKLIWCLIRVTYHMQIRTVFIIDPKKVIRLTLSYPASTGRNFDEVIR
jgi:alkyl hydroperoxide reductase subunit AhpC